MRPIEEAQMRYRAALRDQIEEKAQAARDLKPRGLKAPMHLLPYRPLRAIVGALHDGGTKYAPENWREARGDHREVYGSALRRHVSAYIDPDYSDFDDDSGLHHLAHAGACVLILLYHEGVDYARSNAVQAALEGAGDV